MSLHSIITFLDVYTIR